MQWSLHNIGKMMKQYDYEGYYTENGVAPRKVDISFDENGKYFLIGSKNNTGLMYNVSDRNTIWRDPALTGSGNFSENFYSI